MWWVLTRQTHAAAPTALDVFAITTVADHLFMAWQYYRPARHPIYKTVRGLRVICGYKWRWVDPHIAEQAEPEDSIRHSFHISNLIPEREIWWYLWAPDGPYGLEIQGPLSYVRLPPLHPPPEITDAPINWNIPGRIIRCGNRYTFWTNDTWYALIPTINELTIWRLEDDTFARLDQAHEPTVASGNITDADARLDSIQTYIHIAYYNKVISPNDHLCMYIKFNLTTNAWGDPEIAHAEPYHVWPSYHTSIALDANNVPHIIFPKIHIGFPVFYHRARTGGTWTTADEILWSHLRILSYPSAEIDRFFNAFHCACVTNLYLRWYNEKLPGADVDASMSSLDTGVNLPHHSLAAAPTVPHIAQVAQDWTVEHWEGFPPRYHQDNLSLANSHYANMIAQPQPPGEIAIVFADDDDRLSYLYRPPGADWNPQVQLTPSVLSILTANYAHPDVISCLWSMGGIQSTTFYAFWAPWI